MDPNIPNQPAQGGIPMTQANPLSPPVTQQPLGQQSEILQTPTPPPPSKNKFASMILIIVFFIIFIGISTTVLFAYGKLPIKNYDLQNKIADVLMSIPFMPKTPRFVLESSGNAHLKVTRFSFDTSVAADSSNFNSLLGTGNLDSQIVGKVDYADIKKPLVDLNVKITKDFNLDFRAKDQILYFRINSIPALIAVMLNNFGFKDSIQKQIFYRWLFVDTKPLNTDARAALDSNNNNHQSAIQQGFKNYLDAFNNPDVLKSLSMTDEKINNINVYHVYFAPDDNVLNIFWNKYTKKDQNKTQNSYASNYKISDSVKNFVIDIWIDKSTYLIQKSTVRLSIKSPNNGSANVASPLGMLSSQKEDIPVSVSVKLSDFNKPVVFDIPKDAVKFDDLIKGLMPQMQQVGTPSASVKNNNVNPNITKNNSISNTSSNNGLNIGRCKLYGINKNENNSSFIADGEVVNSGSSSWIIKLDQLNPQYGINIDSNTQFVGKQESSYKVGDCLEATIQSSNLKASTISPQ